MKIAEENNRPKKVKALTHNLVNIFEKKRAFQKALNYANEAYLSDEPRNRSNNRILLKIAELNLQLKRPEDAKWVFRWSAPHVAYDPGEWRSWEDPQYSTFVKVVEY